MPRIKITLPETFTFNTTLPIRITDLNYGGHVGNDTVLTLLHEARVQFLRHFNYTELDLGGVGLIMSDVAIEFKSELFYGDAVKAYVTADDFSKVGFDICYELVNEKNEKVAAIAKTGMVCFDYEKKKVVAVPQEVKERLTS
jgi:YbgC/YbaW family acyl-CoA thioester hydrolase